MSFSGSPHWADFVLHVRDMESNVAKRQKFGELKFLPTGETYSYERLIGKVSVEHKLLVADMSAHRISRTTGIHLKSITHSVIFDKIWGQRIARLADNAKSLKGEYILLRVNEEQDLYKPADKLLRRALYLKAGASNRNVREVREYYHRIFNKDIENGRCNVMLREFANGDAVFRKNALLSLDLSAMEKESNAADY